jgi:hypothetical protein
MAKQEKKLIRMAKKEKQKKRKNKSTTSQHKTTNYSL